MSAAPLLSVRNLSVDFDTERGPLHAVRDISFDIAKGETLALVGESGSGKSVTAASILKLLPYPPASHPSGEIFYEGRDLLKLSDRELRGVRGNSIAMIFQEPMTSLNPLHTIDKQLSETLIVHRGMGTYAARARVLELLHLVQIIKPETRLGAFPHQLSGGQRQRVMIAMALANEPDLLVADEPTTALDVTVQAQILDLLGELQTRLGMAMLFITHNLGLVKKIADRVCVMTNGEIVEHGPTAEIFAHPQHAYTRHLLATEPRGAPPPPVGDPKSLLEVEALKVWFPIKRGFLRRTVGHVRAVDGVDLTIREGRTLGVVGESGSGKSTLGLAVLRLIRSEGRIVFIGRDVAGLQGRQLRPLRRDMQIVFQDPYGSLSPRMTVADIIAEGLLVHFPKLAAAERAAKVEAVLREVGLDPATSGRYPHEFSGGQRQRVAIARAIVLEPRFIVLDEPTSALDVSVQAQIVDLLRGLQQNRGLTYLFISHDLKVVRALAHEVLVMKDGKIVEAGPAAEIFATPAHPYTQALMAAAFDIEAVPAMAPAL